MTTEASPANTAQPAGLTLGQAVKIASIVMLVLTGQTVYTAYTNSWNWSNFTDSGTLTHVLTSMVQATLLGALGAVPRTIQVVAIFWAQPNLWSMIISILQGLAQLPVSLGQRLIALIPPRKNNTATPPAAS